MKSQRTHRREFLRKTSGALIAVPFFVPSSILGKDGETAPSERINVGCIGVGGHGTNRNLKMYLQQKDARVVAVCDVDEKNLRRGKELTNRGYGNKDCKTYKDFRQILDSKDIDTVMISTPDHWHVLMSVLAIKAGKDVQCEKPTLTIDEGKILVKTVRANKAVFQTSTEDRSIPLYHRMAELVRNGRIGELKTIRVRLPQQPGKAGDPTPQTVPKHLDWDMWLGPAPWAEYTKDRVHFHFRWVSDYSGGIICDWGTHLFDTAQWASDTERTGPVKIEGKGTFWKGGLYDTPKTYHVEYTYANGLKMILDHGGTGIRFEGSKGWIESPSWRAKLRASDPKILASEIGPNETKLFTNPAGEHRNFLDCVKTREDPYFPVDIGHRVSTLCHLGNIALLRDGPLEWDPKAERFPKDEKANQLMSREMRKPWSLS
jgi:predicted dehydrogenase